MSIAKPLPAPKGFSSWLEYAVEHFDTRQPWLDSHFAAQISDALVELDRGDIRESARMELRALREAAGE